MGERPHITDGDESRLGFYEVGCCGAEGGGGDAAERVDGCVQGGISARKDLFKKELI